jgi:hypothetical protein
MTKCRPEMREGKEKRAVSCHPGTARSKSMALRRSHPKRWMSPDGPILNDKAAKHQ